MKSTTTILCAISLLSLLCLVMADHHRIIIEERVPSRGQKGRRDTHKNRPRKAPKKSRESDETSFEGNGKYSSEEYFLQKHQDSKPHSSRHPNSHPHLVDFSQLNLEGSRLLPTITEWNPLVSDPTRKHKKKTKKQPSRIPQIFMESTTSFPTIHLHEDSTLNPAIFSPEFVGKQAIEMHHSPFAGAEQFSGLDHLKSANVVYDISSSEAKLSPFVVEQRDVSESEKGKQESREEPDTEVTTHKPRRSRSRGRGAHRTNSRS